MTTVDDSQIPGDAMQTQPSTAEEISKMYPPPSDNNESPASLLFVEPPSVSNTLPEPVVSTSTSVFDHPARTENTQQPKTPESETKEKQLEEMLRAAQIAQAQAKQDAEAREARLIALIAAARAEAEAARIALKVSKDDANTSTTVMTPPTPITADLAPTPQVSRKPASEQPPTTPKTMSTSSESPLKESEVECPQPKVDNVAKLTLARLAALKASLNASSLAKLSAKSSGGSLSSGSRQENVEATTVKPNATATKGEMNKTPSEKSTKKDTEHDAASSASKGAINFVTHPTEGAALRRLCFLVKFREHQATFIFVGIKSF
jgi:hypothetical protein